MKKNNNINIDEMISRATKEAIKEYDREKKQEQRKKVFHNTRLLLSHYNDLKNHVENAIDDINKLKDHELVKSDYIDMSKEYDEFYILSLKRSKIKTLIMVSHIDMALEILKQKQYRACSIEKYEALRMFYIDEKTYEEIQEYFKCGINTPRRWINETTNELSILLFGIDGLKLDVV
jgi:hypothetical protein